MENSYSCSTYEDVGAFIEKYNLGLSMPQKGDDQIIILFELIKALAEKIDSK